MLSFNFTDFSDTSGLIVLGGAQTTGDDVLRLADDNHNSLGGVWYGQRQLTSVAFETTFDYQLSGGSDGFAFVIQNDSDGTTALEGPASDIGYEGLTNCLAVEFDSWYDGNEPTDQMCIQSNGTEPNSADYDEATQGAVPYNTDEEPHDVKITYTAATATFALFVDDMDTPILTAVYDITQIGLDEGTAYVGFTGSTDESICSWEMQLS